jgi:uncharacterized protein YdhG (YjbR/CyaY superfamily)
MVGPSKKSVGIDEYIGNHPPNVQKILQELRGIVHEMAPEAQEAISYSMPTFKLNGNLVHFAAYEKHIGFYPTPSGITAFRERLSPYRTSKGAVQFPINEQIPYDLVRDIVRFRLKENLEKVKKKL